MFFSQPKRLPPNDLLYSKKKSKTQKYLLSYVTKSNECSKLKTCDIQHFLNYQNKC